MLFFGPGALTQSMAVLPDFEADHCKPACRTNFSGCEKSCNDTSSKAAGYGTPNYDIKLSQELFWQCVHGESGGCDAVLNACYQSCDAFFAKYYGMPAGQRPAIDDYKERFSAFESGDADALSAKPAEVPAVAKPAPPKIKAKDKIPPVARPTPKVIEDKTVTPEKVADKTVEADSECPRFCNGNILMENGRMGSDGQCWYNPTRCGSCDQTDGFAHCVETEQEKMAALRTKIRKKRRMVKLFDAKHPNPVIDEKGHREYVDDSYQQDPCSVLTMFCSGDDTYFFNFKTDELDVTHDLPESIQELEAINRGYTQVLNSKIQIVNKQVEDRAIAEIEGKHQSEIEGKHQSDVMVVFLEAAHHVIDNDLDRVVDDTVIGLMYDDFITQKWLEQREDLNPFPMYVSGLINSFVTQQLLPNSVDRGREQIRELLRIYMKEWMRYEITDPRRNSRRKEEYDLFYDGAHVSATEKVVEHWKAHYEGDESNLLERPFIRSADIDIMTAQLNPRSQMGRFNRHAPFVQVFAATFEKLKQDSGKGDAEGEAMVRKKNQAILKFLLAHQLNKIQEVAE
jgi:hypothetical protein